LAAAAVVDPDRCVRTSCLVDPCHHEVGDGTPGGEVEVRGCGMAVPTWGDGQVAGRLGGDGGEGHDDRVGGVGYPGTAEVHLSHLVGTERTAVPAGVEHSVGGYRCELAGGGEPAGDVGEDLGGSGVVEDGYLSAVPTVAMTSFATVCPVVKFSVDAVGRVEPVG